MCIHSHTEHIHTSKHMTQWQTQTHRWSIKLAVGWYKWLNDNDENKIIRNY